MKCKILSVLLIPALVISLLLPVAALGEPLSAPGETIIIETAEDFLSFAKLCVLDSRSRDITVILKTDLVLEENTILPVPTFGGTFDGGGHTIRGLRITDEVSPAGLFGSLQPTAVVKNLHLCAEVTPAGECGAAGGIAGENYGKIENCTFEGTVHGHMNTGALVGSNFGSVLSSSAKGTVVGDSRTGGIAGYNDGRISGCRNEADINAESVDPTLNPTKIDLDFSLDFSRISKTDVGSAASDSGGIVGYSDGEVTTCTNLGTVGYPHIGYNLGGIAGRNSGFMDSCENRGAVSGRKDTGGIVGQLEPHIVRVLSQDYLETLSKQFQSLGGLVSVAGGDGAEMGQKVQDRLQELSAYESTAVSAVGDLASAASGGEIDEGALSTLGSAVQGMVNVSGVMRKDIGDGVDDLTGDISAIAGQIAAISRTFALATEDAKQDTFTDLSDVDVSAITAGRILNCVNIGAVDADLNVGGIAGTMGIEATADPEDNMPEGSLTQRRRYELKVIADSCENAGSVTAKRSYAGGICGRMELGLITECRGYGRIVSDSGDYVGGIAGLAGGRVRDCFAKCTLSGNRYVGGIVGCGVDVDIHGESSTVADCYSMVDIQDAAQFYGAVSGDYAGVFTGNYFVSDTLAGINRVSYAALAEPVSYEKMQTLRKLPESSRELTLRFVADGQTVKTVPFHYGDSFDDTVYPELPRKEGCYTRWSIRDLSNLHFDTVVEADFLPYITSLCSEECRNGERPVFFVQGQFQERDSLTITPGETAYSGHKVLEHRHLTIPADGLAEHTVRYLPEEENVQIYLLKSGKWSAVHPRQMGSYIAFETAGMDVELVVTKADSIGILTMIIAVAAVGAVVVLSAVAAKRGTLSVLRQKFHGKIHLPKSAKWIFILLVVLAAAALAFRGLMPQTKTMQAVRIYDIVHDFLSTDEQRFFLTVDARTEDRSLNFSADVQTMEYSGKKLSIITEGSRSLYYCDGVVMLENGDAFRLNTAAPDYSELLGAVAELVCGVEIASSDGVYTVTAEGEQALALARLLMPELRSLLPDAVVLTVELRTEEGTLTELSVSGAGNLTDSVRSPFSLLAVAQMAQPQTVQIPDSVSRKVESGAYDAHRVYSGELVQLLQAWSRISRQQATGARVELTAQCGSLSVDETLDAFGWRFDEGRIFSVVKSGKPLYYGGGKVCRANGGLLTANGDELNPAKLSEVLYRAFRDADFKSRKETDATVYTVSLDSAGMEELAIAVVPQLQKFDISYTRGTLSLTLRSGSIELVQLSCAGSAKLAALSADVYLSAKITPDASMEVPPLPDAVRENLLQK